jgi:hypothetical protein
MLRLNSGFRARSKEPFEAFVPEALNHWFSVYGGYTASQGKERGRIVASFAGSTQFFHAALPPHSAVRLSLTVTIPS